MNGAATIASRYGAFPVQAGELLVPPAAMPPVVCLLHGGFWRMPHGREQWQAVALDLVGRGYAVWTPGYRRIGEAGGGWPGTFEDVASNIAHLEALARLVPLDLDRLALVGHSAGGHLALWAASAPEHPGPGERAESVRIRAVAALAPVADLARAWTLDLGNGAVGELLGGSPAEHPGRYAIATPMPGAAQGRRVAIFHGTEDHVVPVGLSRAHVEAARAAGGDMVLHEVAAAGHMDFLDPASRAHAALCDWLTGALRD